MWKWFFKNLIQDIWLIVCVNIYTHTYINAFTQLFRLSRLGLTWTQRWLLSIEMGYQHTQTI